MLQGQRGDQEGGTLGFLHALPGSPKTLAALLLCVLDIRFLFIYSFYIVLLNICQVPIEPEHCSRYWEYSSA